MSQANINGVDHESTTVQLAATVPKEEKEASPGDDISTTTPGAAIAAQVPLEKPAALDATTPGDDAVPGGFPNTPRDEKPESTPAVLQQEQAFSVNPLPASDTAENPIKLAPGEPVPGYIGTQSLHSNVKLDKESYEKGATNYPIDSFILPDVTPAEQGAAEGRGVLDLPPVSRNTIPESSLPIASAADASKKDVKVPEVVKDSQVKADEPAEASGVSEAVVNKAEMEKELKSEVHPTPSTAEGNSAVSQAANTVGKTAEQIKNETTEHAGNATPQTYGLAASAAASISATVASIAAATGLGGSTEVAASVPEIVKESLAETGAPVEAAAVKESVEAKEAMESELKQEVTLVTGEDASAASVSAAAISAQETPVVTNGVTTKTTVANDIVLNKPVDMVPTPVKESVAESGLSAEAATAIGHKEALEDELKRQVKPVESTAFTSESAAPATMNGTKRTEPITLNETNGINGSTSNPDKNIKEPTASPPIGTNPTVSSKPEEIPTTPAAKTSEPGDISTGKAHKRKGFFVRLKEKFHRSS
jgi:hypothetical protein